MLPPFFMYHSLHHDRVKVLNYSICTNTILEIAPWRSPYRLVHIKIIIFRCDILTLTKTSEQILPAINAKCVYLDWMKFGVMIPMKKTMVWPYGSHNLQVSRFYLFFLKIYTLPFCCSPLLSLFCFFSLSDRPTTDGERQTQLTENRQQTDTQHKGLRA